MKATEEEGLKGDYTQYNKLRNGEATPDVAEVHSAAPRRGQAWQHNGLQVGRGGSVRYIAPLKVFRDGG